MDIGGDWFENCAEGARGSKSRHSIRRDGGVGSADRYIEGRNDDSFFQMKFCDWNRGNFNAIYSHSKFWKFR